jgi:hypothetical protein
VPGHDRAGVRRGGPGRGREAGRPRGRHRHRCWRRAGPRDRAPDRRPRPGRRAAHGRGGRRPAGDPRGRGGGRHPAPDRGRRGTRLPGAQAGAAGLAARPGDPARGPLPAAPGHRHAQVGGRHPDHPGRAGERPRRRSQRPASAGARLQHLLRPGPGRHDPSQRRPGGGRGDARAPGQPGTGDARPTAIQRRRDPGQARRQLRGRVQVRRRARTGPPHRRRPDRAVHPAAGAHLHPVPRHGGAAQDRHQAARGDPGGRASCLRPGVRGPASLPGCDVPPAQVRHNRGGP